MKKKLLLILLAVVGMSSAYADNYQNGDYIYTRNGKYKVVGENMIENGDFSNGSEGWTTAYGNPLAGTQPTDTFLIRETGGPNDGPYIYQQLGSSSYSVTSGDCIHKAIRIMDPGTYVVTYKVRNEGSANLGTSATSASGRNSNYENVFTNADGAVATITSSKADWWTFAPGVWTEVAYNVTIAADGTDDYINIVNTFHAGGSVSFADFGVYPVQEVGDTRRASDAVEMVNYFVNNPDFPNEQETLTDVLKDLQDLIEGETDPTTLNSTVYNILYDPEGDFQWFLDENSVNVANYFTNFDFNASTTNKGVLPAGWNAADGSNISQISVSDATGAYTSNQLRQENRAYSYDSKTYEDMQAAVITQTVDLPGGKYIYIVQGSANKYAQDGRGGSSNYYWYRQGLKYEGVKCVVNGIEQDMDIPVPATIAKTFVFSFDTEDGDKTVGFSLPGQTDHLGGNLRIDNIQFRLVGANQEDVDDYFNKSQMIQHKAALKVILDSANVVKADPAYIFENSVLVDSIALAQTVYDTDYKATFANVDIVKNQKTYLESALRSYYRANAELTALRATLAEAQALEADETRPKAKENLVAKNAEIVGYIAQQTDQSRDSLTLVTKNEELIEIMTLAYAANATYSTPAKLRLVNPDFKTGASGGVIPGWKYYAANGYGNRGWRVGNDTHFDSGRSMYYARAYGAKDELYAWQQFDVTAYGEGVYEFYSNAFGALTTGQPKGTEREIYMYLGPTTNPEAEKGNYETANKVMVSSYCSNQGGSYGVENSDPYVVRYIAPADVSSIEFGMYKTATTGNCIAFSDCVVLYYGPYDAYRADSMRAAMAPTLAEFQESINAATELNKERYYATADHETFVFAIGKAQSEHDRIAAAAYSETLFQELQDAIAQFDADVATFKNSVKITVLLNLVDAISMEGATVSGSVGTMTVSNYEGDYAFYVDAEKAALRVGNGADTLKLTKVPDAEGFLHISYDMYFAGLSGRNVYVNLLDNSENRIAGYRVQPYSSVWGNPEASGATGEEYDDFKFDWSGVSAPSASIEDMSADLKTSFDFVYDMQGNKITATIGSKAAVECSASGEPSKFIVGSTYNYANVRRCWIKNLKVEVIGNAVAPTGITDTQAAGKVAVKPVKRIVKGQLVIEKNGKFFDAVGKRIK